jgi:hypothetical protein
MKKLLLILLCLPFIFISCNTYENELKAYNDIVEVELSRDTIISDVFLGLSYGDSWEAANEKLDKLRNRNKISRNQYHSFKYEYEFGIVEKKGILSRGYLKAIIDLKFHKDKLYLIELLTGLGEYPSSTFLTSKEEELVHKKLNLIYLGKYGSAQYKYIEVKNPYVLIDDNYFICANNQIMISSSIGTKITYTDLRVLKEIEKERKKKRKIYKANQKEKNKKDKIKLQYDL